MVIGMPRPLRIEYPCAIYHVMSGGDQRQNIFSNDADRLRFVSTLGEACQKTGLQVHAYCLMHNHFHFVIETPSANLVTGMSQMEERRGWETQADHRHIRRGWRLGDDQFRKKLLVVGKSAGGSHYGSERQERDQEKLSDGGILHNHIRLGRDHWFSSVRKPMRRLGGSGGGCRWSLCQMILNDWSCFKRDLSISARRLRMAALAANCSRRVRGNGCSTPAPPDQFHVFNSMRRRKKSVS